MDTKHVFVEVRVDKASPKINRFHLVQHESMSSSKINPETSRSDSDYKYYEYSALLHDRRKCLIVIDLEPTSDSLKRSEIYDLKKHGLSISSVWSEWRDPDATVNPSHVLGSAFQALETQKPPSNLYQSPKKTNLRYRIERWNRP